MNLRLLKEFIAKTVEKEFGAIPLKEAFPTILSEGIVHLENLKPEQLLAFLKSWNENKSQFFVSEKVDGNYMAVGMENGRFYVRSKNKVFRSAAEVPNIFFLHDFKKFYSLLENVPWNDIISALGQKFGFEYTGNFEIEGEAVPSYDHNIVVYDEKKIGEGVFIIFNAKTNFGKEVQGKKDRSLSNPKLWKELSAQINKHSPIKFYSVPDVDLSALEFNEQIIVDLEDLVAKHGNLFAKPARTPEDKQLKDQLLAQVIQLGKKAKQNVLQQNIQSQFGPEVEGIVVASPSGDLIKVVDMEKFTKTKTANWHFIEQLNAAEKSFKKAIAASPGDLKNHLKAWLSEINTIESDFEKNGSKYLTIQKKFADTRNGIQYSKSLISVMMAELKKGTPPEQVVEKFNGRALITENLKEYRQSYGSSKKKLKEGGNVFKNEMSGILSAVPREAVDANIRYALKLSGLRSIEYHAVGNISKSIANDIDIAVNKTDIANAIGIDTEDFWTQVGPALKAKSKIPVAVNKGFATIHLLSPYVDQQGKPASPISPTGEEVGSEPGAGKVQIDLFVGDKEWTKNVRSGSPQDSQYKAVYRNLLIADILNSFSFPDPSEPGVFKRYLFSDLNGFKVARYKTVAGKKPVKIDEKIVTTNADDVAKLMFGPDVSWNDINSFEKLYRLFVGPKFRNPSKRSEILNQFRKTIAEKKLNLPKELN